MENNGDGYKQILICEVKDDTNEMRLHVQSDNEAILALAHKKLGQAIDYHLAMQAKKKKATEGIVQANPSIFNRLK